MLIFYQNVTGSFELAVLRMSRYLDLQQNCVLYGDTLLPQDAFYTTDTAEMKLVSFVFELAKSIAELKLTETELALYSAAVLLSPGKCGTNIYRTFHPRQTKLSKIVIKKCGKVLMLKICDNMSSACTFIYLIR